MTTFQGMKNRSAVVTASLLAGVGLFALSLPADSQESLLPPGFDQPAAPKAEPKPKSDPAPKAEPKSGSGGESRPSTSQPSSSQSSSGQSSSGQSSSGQSSSGSSVSSDSGSSSSGSSVSSASSSSSSASASKDAEEDANDEITRVRKYDLPAGSRRSLDRIGPLSSAEGGLGENAYWGAGGNYLSILMDKTDAPIVSRWGSILLRRAASLPRSSE